MKNINKFIDILHNDKLCQYLLQNSWKELSLLFNGKVRQFLSPDEQNAILIPTNKDFSDYYDVMKNSLNTIAEFEHISLEGLFNQIVKPTCDILKFRIDNNMFSSGLLSFNLLKNNLNLIEGIISSACLDIIKPAIVHKKVFIKEVQEQLKQYSFGQTEIGSYILNLVCPLGYYQYDFFNDISNELPLCRKININILKNINNIQQSIVTKSSRLRDDVSEGKISINFLKAVSDLYNENINNNFSISVVWSSYIPNFEDDIINYVELQPKCMDKILEVVDEFSPKKEININKTFYGKIINISGEAEVDHRLDFSITIVSFDSDIKQVNVKANLNYDKYFCIVDKAFQNGSNVKVSGIVESYSHVIFLKQAIIEELD